MRKQIPLFLAAVIMLGLLYAFHTELAMQSIATDSGFDTSYDSGGGYSGGSDSWSSYDSSSSSGGGDLTYELPPVGAMILISSIVLALFVITAIVLLVKEGWKKGKIDVLVALAFYVGIDVLILFPLYVITLFVIAMVIFVLYMSLSSSPKKTKISSIRSSKKYKEIPLEEGDQELVNESYIVFYNVQMAWMNFDYDALKNLVTDELYNMYCNQLDTLKIKNQKNIMNQFELTRIFLVKKEKKDDLITFQVQLEVSFYDYIVDEKEKVVRGNKNRKVHMTYLLTFVYNEKSIECPGCGASLDGKQTTCPYCGSPIQAVGNSIRLSKKEVLEQR